MELDLETRERDLQYNHTIYAWLIVIDSCSRSDDLFVIKSNKTEVG